MNWFGRLACAHPFLRRRYRAWPRFLGVLVREPGIGASVVRIGGGFPGRSLTRPECPAPCGSLTARDLFGRGWWSMFSDSEWSRFALEEEESAAAVAPAVLLIGAQDAGLLGLRMLGSSTGGAADGGESFL